MAGRMMGLSSSFHDSVPLKPDTLKEWTQELVDIINDEMGEEDNSARLR